MDISFSVTNFQELQKEAARDRHKLEQLKAKVNEGIKLSEIEKDSFCSLIDNSSDTIDGIIEDYMCCENYKFRKIYTIYYRNLAGGIIYYKPNKEKFKREIMNNLSKGLTDFSLEYPLYEVPIEEVNKDLSYLSSVANQWAQIIAKRNNSDNLIIAASKEANVELKEFEKLNKRNPFFLKGKKYYKERMAIVLRSKYMYLKVKLIIDNYLPSDFILNFNDENIFITELSLIHIVSNHFSAITRQFYIDKTYHVEDIRPEELPSFLQRLFKLIGSVSTQIKISVSKIIFKYKNHIYIIYTNIDDRFEKGKGQIYYRRLKTFYRMSEVSIKREIRLGYSEYVINDEFSIFHEAVNGITDKLPV